MHSRTSIAGQAYQYAGVEGQGVRQANQNEDARQQDRVEGVEYLTFSSSMGHLFVH